MENFMNQDNWIHRSKNMLCQTCIWYVPKGIEPMANLGRCRKNAPTMDGFPVVFHDDWCGDHKLDESKVIHTDSSESQLDSTAVTALLNSNKTYEIS